MAKVIFTCVCFIWHDPCGLFVTHIGGTLVSQATVSVKPATYCLRSITVTRLIKDQQANVRLCSTIFT